MKATASEKKMMQDFKNDDETDQFWLGLNES